MFTSLQISGSAKTLLANQQNTDMVLPFICLHMWSMGDYVLLNCYAAEQSYSCAMVSTVATIRTQLECRLLDTLGPRVFTDDAIFVEGLGDWILLLFLLFSLGGLVSSLSLLSCLGGCGSNSLGLGSTSLGLLAVLLHLS